MQMYARIVPEGESDVEAFIAKLPAIAMRCMEQRMARERLEASTNEEGSLVHMPVITVNHPATANVSPPIHAILDDPTPPAAKVPSPIHPNKKEEPKLTDVIPDDPMEQEVRSIADDFNYHD